MGTSGHEPRNLHFKAHLSHCHRLACLGTPNSLPLLCIRISWDLLRMQVLIWQVWSQAWESAFLMSPQVMLIRCPYLWITHWVLRVSVRGSQPCTNIRITQGAFRAKVPRPYPQESCNCLKSHQRPSAQLCTGAPWHWLAKSYFSVFRNFVTQLVNRSTAGY